MSIFTRWCYSLKTPKIYTEIIQNALSIIRYLAGLKSSFLYFNKSRQWIAGILAIFWSINWNIWRYFCCWCDKSVTGAMCWNLITEANVNLNLFSPIAGHNLESWVQGATHQSTIFEVTGRYPEISSLFSPPSCLEGSLEQYKSNLSDLIFQRNLSRWLAREFKYFCYSSWCWSTCQDKFW